MGNGESIIRTLMQKIEGFSVEDFQDGNAYAEMKLICENYEIYEIGCKMLDEVGKMLGVDAETLSHNHSVHVRCFFYQDVKIARLGPRTLRGIVKNYNAAPDAFNCSNIIPLFPEKNFVLEKDFEIENKCIYCKEKLERVLISTTLISPVSIEYDEEKDQVLYRFVYDTGHSMKEFTALPTDIHNLKFIRGLANRGIGIKLKHADKVREFLESTIDLNRGHSIREIYSVSRFGWIKRDEEIVDFSPFSERYVYSQENTESNPFFKHLCSYKGDLGKWVELINRNRDDEHIAARIVLAASFASVLVEILNLQLFAVDIWGSVSGSGKSVSIMNAASVWANPQMEGAYILKCKNTGYSLEAYGALLNNLPLILDETQTVENRKQFQNWIYNLCSGQAHGALKRDGSLRIQKSWKNCIITSGEQPLLSDTRLAGATNRVIEIEAPEKVLFQDKTAFGPYITDLLENYGLAGRVFVDKLCFERNRQKAKTIYESFNIQLCETASGKQASIGAVLLTADNLAAEWIFKDDVKLSVDDIAPYLKNEDEINTNERTHEMIISWIVTNSGKFANKDSSWGKFSKHNGKATCDIIKMQLVKFLQSNQLNLDSYLSWARQNRKIYCEKDGHMEVKVRFKPSNGEEIRPRCICIYYEEAEAEGNQNES